MSNEADSLDDGAKDTADIPFAAIAHLFAGGSKLIRSAGALGLELLFVLLAFIRLSGFRAIRPVITEPQRPLLLRRIMAPPEKAGRSLKRGSDLPRPRQC
jgi:hypothetical protein